MSTPGRKIIMVGMQMAGINDDEFTSYVRNTRTELRRTAFRLTADWYEADDLVQRTLIVLHQRWESLRDRDSISSYVYTVMLHLMISDRRAHRWSSEILHERPPEPDPVPDTWTYSGDRSLLISALAALSPRQRAAVVMRYWEDRSVNETAQALGCRHSTVRSQTTRALSTLRSVLEPALQDGNSGDASAGGKPDD